MVRIILGFTLWICLSLGPQSHGQDEITFNAGHPIIGKWVRIGHSGPVAFTFHGSGIVEGDFGDDGNIDVRSTYAITGDTILFADIDGQACEGIGVYKLDLSEFYLSFDMLEDMCGGRIKVTAGFWTRPDFTQTLKTLKENIGASDESKLNLERGRVYMALGESEKARADLDTYLANNSSDARAFMNRAATFFPFDPESVVGDCNRALALDPNLKNAYFMRGLALYDLGNPEDACKDFEKAIDLGFIALKDAEKNKCAQFWEN